EPGAQPVGGADLLAAREAVGVLLTDAAHRPSHVLVLAWRFADMIISRQQAFAAQGGRFIVPLPDVQVR
ncbi:MAG: hypothetical protein ABL982_15675, partial [Vicinamibacterales bacterium]